MSAMLLACIVCRVDPQHPSEFCEMRRRATSMLRPPAHVQIWHLLHGKVPMSFCRCRRRSSQAGLTLAQIVHVLAVQSRCLPQHPCHDKVRNRLTSHPPTNPIHYSMIPIILLLIKQIRPRTPQINNLRTPIPILLRPRALETIKSIAYPLTTTDDTFVLVVPEAAFVADSD